MRKFYLSLSRYLTVPLILVTSVAWSQSKAINGKVTSADDGSGIPGVNVLEKHSSNSTVTDANGSYSISIANSSTVVFSFVGYTTQEVAVGDQTTIDVELELDVTSLNE